MNQGYINLGFKCLDNNLTEIVKYAIMRNRGELMKNKGFLFKILALVSAVASVVFACLLRFNVRISAGGESSNIGNSWSIFGDATRAEKVELAQLGSIEYDETIRTFAVFLLVVMIAIMAVLIVLTLYGKFSKNPFEACSGTCNILSVVLSLLGVGLLISVLSYTGANSSIFGALKTGVAVSNVVMLVFHTIFAVLTSVLYITGAVNTKK